MTLSPSEFATQLEQTLVGGFNPIRIAKVAFKIYHQHALEITPAMKDVLLTLMVMEEGPEFELSEVEFLEIIDKVRAM